MYLDIIKLLVLVLIAQLVSVATADKVICPTYIVKPGDTLSSIASSSHVNVVDLTNSITACGASTEILTPGQTICLPGAELPGCVNVRSFLGNNKCKYYVSQLGDSLASIASSLNLYQPDLEKANSGIQANQLKEGDLLKVSTWDVSKCGTLPANMEQLTAFLDHQQQDTSPPPPPSPPSPPIKTIVKPGTVITGTVNANNCRAYRAIEGDTIFSVASTFSCSVDDLLQINPDLADGLPVTDGSIVKLPPYDPSCLQPILTTLSPPTMGPSSGNGELVKVSISNDNIASPPSSGGDNSSNNNSSNTTDSNTNGAADKGKAVVTSTQIIIQTSDDMTATDNTVGGGTAVVSSTTPATTITSPSPLYTNIVSDAASGYSSPPPQSTLNAGMLITIMCCVFILFAIVGVLGMSCSGSSSMSKSDRADKASSNFIEPI